MDLRALDRLGDEIAELSVHLEAATARLLDLIREFDARGGWNNGFRSCAEWLSWRVGLDLGAAREKVRVARALATLPQLAQALARGELSYAKVRALTRVATPETEERLLAIGRAGTAEHVERIVRGWRRMDRKAEQDEAARQHASRALYVYPAEDGTVTIRGRLAPEAGALLLKALTAAREALYQRERNETRTLRRMSPWNRRRWPSNRPTPCSCWRRPRCTTASIPARRPSTTRWWFTWTPACWKTPINPASRSSKMAHAFLQKRLSASDATRAEWSCGMMPRVGSSRSAPRPARSRRRCGERCSIGIAAAASPAATAVSARPTTFATGPRAAPPRCLTSSCSAAATTERSTRRAIRSIDSPMVSFASAGRMAASCLMCRLLRRPRLIR